MREGLFREGEDHSLKKMGKEEEEEEEEGRVPGRREERR